MPRPHVFVTWDGFFDDDNSDNCQGFSLSGISFSGWFLLCCGVGAGWVLFSTESLILAQDERWRRA